MNKRIAISIFLTIGSLSCFAQFNTESFYFTGATRGKIGFWSQSDEFTSNQNSIFIGLFPEAGYFIRNRLAVGGAIDLEYERFLGDFAFAEYDIIMGPAVRYYLPRDTDMQIFLLGFAGYGGVPSHQKVMVMVGPGANFFLTERVAFELKLPYSFAIEWNPAGGGSHNIHEVRFMVGLSLFFSDLTFITRKGDLVE